MFRRGPEADLQEDAAAMNALSWPRATAALTVALLLGTVGCGAPLGSPVEDSSTGNLNGSTDAVNPEPDKKPAVELVVSSHDNSAVTEYVLGSNGDVESWRYIVPPQGPLKLWPHGLAYLSEGQLLVSMRGIHRLRRYDLATGALLGEFGANTPVNTPIATIVDKTGTAYVTSLESHAVLAFNPKSGTYLGSLTGANNLLLNRPGGATLSPDGWLYVANDTANTVVRMDVSGREITKFASPPPGTTPGGLAFGPDGLLYLSDQANARILRFDGKTGEFVDEFVPPGSGGMRHPLTIAFGPDGDLYVCSYESHAILRFDGKTGAFILSILPPGHPSELRGPTWVLIRARP